MSKCEQVAVGEVRVILHGGERQYDALGDTGTDRRQTVAAKKWLQTTSTLYT
jgi:hypothetical protein